MQRLHAPFSRKPVNHADWHPQQRADRRGWHVLTKQYSFQGQHPHGYFQPLRAAPAIVSPLHEDDFLPLVQLRAQGYQILVISPNPVKFELSYLPKNRNVELAGRIIHMERGLLLQKVQRASIQVLDWDVAEPFDLVVKRMLSRPPAWLRAVGR